MLRVRASQLVLSPAVSAKLNRERQEAYSFYSLRPAQRRQQRFEFCALALPDLRKAIANVFHQKCAYCETVLGVDQSGMVSCYRPKSSVMEDIEHPGYWWLAHTANNLLLLCMACNMSKRNRFPLRDTEGRAHSPAAALENERPLLLDPYADDPQAHLVFEESGSVASTTAQGKMTIAVLDLNRPGLVSVRKKYAQQIRYLVHAIEAALRGPTHHAALEADLKQRFAQLKEMTSAHHAYAGANRQFIRRTALHLRLPASSFDWLESSPGDAVMQEMEARLEQASFVAEQSNYSLENARGLEKYRLQSRTIETISIVNIRTIDQLHIDMSRGPAEAGAWMVLLGENGTGKTTVLRAIAAALAGTDICTSLIEQDVLVPAAFIRHRCKSGHVKVKISGFPQAHEIVFSADGLRMTSGTGETSALKIRDGKVERTGKAVEAPTILLGYGATRLAPRPNAASPEDFGRAARISNLFNPFMPLSDADAWLNTLGVEEFAKVAMILQDLLGLPADAKFGRRGGKVSIKLHEIVVPLRQLSDGYQGMIALTADILQTASRIWPKLTDAEGIVLLDEIGTHLHPRWQMRVVSSLRTALPGIQFIVTTHDPLCLRGVGKGEVVVLQRDVNGRMEATTDLPSPGDFRVDQLLTSSFFGLNSTADPLTENLFNEYYLLLAKQKPTKEQKARLAALKKELKDRQHFGDTPRQERMYQLIDKDLARQRQHGPRTLPDLEDEDVSKISSLWQRALAEGRKTS